MKRIVTELSYDLKSMMTPPVIRAAEWDTARSLRIRLTSGAAAYEIAPNAYAILMGRKADGTSLYNVCRIEDNAILYDFTEQTSTAPGLAHLQIRLHSEEGLLLTTMPLTLEVYPVEFDAEEAVKSQDEQTALDDLVNKTRALQMDILHDKQTGAFQGESAYEIAERLGFQGTEEQWMESLRYDHSEEFTFLVRQVREAQTAAAGSASAAAQYQKTAEARAGEAFKSAQMAKTEAEQAKTEADRSAAMGLTDASPGDLIKVMAVNEAGVPTAWEKTKAVAEIYKSWHALENLAIEEGQDIKIYSREVNLLSVHISIDFPDNTPTMPLTVKILGGIWGNQGLFINTYEIRSAKVLDLTLDGSSHIFRPFGDFGNPGAIDWPISQNCRNIIKDLDGPNTLGIRKIEFSSTAAFPAGTQILIKGVDFDDRQ